MRCRGHKTIYFFSIFPQHRRNSKNGSFHGSNSGSRRGSIEQLIRTNAISDEVNEMFLSQAAAIDDKFCLDDSGKPIAPQPKGQAHHMSSRILNLRIFLHEIFFVWFFYKVEVFYSDQKLKSNMPLQLELVSKELNHFGVIAGLFRQIGGS